MRRTLPYLSAALLALAGAALLTWAVHAYVTFSPAGARSGKPAPAGVFASPAMPRTTPTRAARTRPTLTPRREVRTPPRTASRRVPTGSRLSVTAYCWTGNRTASGAWPQIGMAAGNRWPFGTRLRVEGWGVVTITDRIGHGSELDIYMGREGCRSRALAFGRRSLRVEVVR